ncbi:cullin-3B-like [Pistacia vera]|uniref:cullin-3B-like n=1 Tax=Pistacia vera TaxID=55513 RepID=UPI001263BEAE|nr:cullin-3B-like [Pistacia vera]
MSGPKKRTFQIEASKHQVVVDPKYAEKTWKILEHAIHEIYNHNDSGLNMEELYRNAYNMVLHKFGEKLYSGLVTTMTFHLTEICKSIEAAQGGLFLEELNRKWADHNKALQMIRNIFMYMDRTFIPSTHKTPVHELGLNLWRDVVIHSSKIQTSLQDTLLELVRRERSGEVINRGLMRNITKMLMDLGSVVYQDDFEKHFLEVSADFYRLESQEFIESCDCGEYLKKAERRLNEEIERVSHYLDVKSESKITNVVESEMIESHMQRLVHMENSGIVNMLADDKYEDLGRIYSLFRWVPSGLILIRDVMTSYIRDSGKQLVIDPERLKDPVDFVQRLLDLKDKYDKIISTAFDNDKTFQNALNSSFEYFINLNSRSPEFISLFVDDKLRKGLRGVSEEDVENVLDKVMMLFRYLQEKDIFEKYYEQHLAKRLLAGKQSDDAERSLIVKLKTECGYQFTSKLEGILTDMKTSQDTMQGDDKLLHGDDEWE